MILGAEIGLSQVVSGVVGAATSAALLLGILDKRRKDISNTWKELYEAKKEENSELENRLTRCEARVEFFESAFIRKVAQGVTDAIIHELDERRNHGKG